MTIRFYEHPDSRSGSVQAKDGNRSLVYVCLGTRSDATAYGTALGSLPIVDDFGFILHDISIKPETSGPTDDDCSWIITANYVHPESEQAKEAEEQRNGRPVDWTFRVAETSGEISHALHQTEYPGGLVDDAGVHKRAINVADDGSVRGVGIPLPTVDLIVWKHFPRALLKGTQGIAFLKQMRKVASTQNDAAWWGFEAGELRLKEVVPEDVGTLWVKVTYTFATEENARNIDFGDIGGANVNVPLKKGQEYIWVYHKRDADDAGKEMIARPWRVCVAQVLRESNYTQLGLPNAPP